MRISLALLLLTAAPAYPQDTTPESELDTATRATISRGFAFVVKSNAGLPDGFPQDRLALAGTTVHGEYADGAYHAKDGVYEIYKKKSMTLVRSERGWLPIDQFTSPLKVEIAQAFDERDGRLWRRGNVTAGRKAVNQLIQISHLDHRTDIEHLTRLQQALMDLKVVRIPSLNGKPATLYEGEIAETVAFDILQGPFGSLVERGNLAFRNVSGVGRIYLQDGLVRRVVLRVAGAYSAYDDTDNVKRRGTCTLDVTAELSRYGEVRVELPREAALLK